MCGILGIICAQGYLNNETFQAGLQALKHRGPDDVGSIHIPVNHQRELWLGHTRLSIVDLSKSGHQPMVSKSGSVVFNGEIYNFRTLRNEIGSKWEFGSQTDTEVILAGVLNEGVDFVRKLNGMFSFVVFDERTNILTLARDRLGKKPLYIYQSKDVFAFASELKAFEAMGLSLEVDTESLAFYRWLSYIPAERTIYRECVKFPASSVLELDIRQDLQKGYRPYLYWDPLKAASTRFSGTYQQAQEAFSSLLDEVTQDRLIADVPIGVFLSGGVDSSLVASSLARLHKTEIQSFTVKPEDKSLDESEVALRTARQLGLASNILFLSKQDYNRQIPKIGYHYDEPFSDSSEIPTMAIAEAARKSVTVVLTGDGGDELFLGYERLTYPSSLGRYRKWLEQIPGMLPIARKLLQSPAAPWLMANILKVARRRTEYLDLKIEIINELLQTKHLASLHEYFLVVRPKSFLNQEDRSILGNRSLLDWCETWYPNYSWEAMRERSLPELLGAIDMVSYMRDDILVKVDRATMAYSLEARSPLLDYRMAEFAMSLPLEFKIHEGRYKRILRDTLKDRVGAQTAELPKKGFSIPLSGAELPPGHSVAAQWNTYIENQWQEQHGKSKI
jgi:asparagine synthase (glutamine-hydrolysing)